MKILKGDKARDFWNKAMEELENKTPLKEQKYLNQKCVGHFREGAYYIAFDNTSGELFTEEFATLSKTLRYIHFKI